MIQVLVVPFRLEGFNQALGAKRKVLNRNAKTGRVFDGWAKLKGATEERIALLARSQRLRPVPGPIRATFAFYEAGRRDSDSPLVGVKMVLDAFVREKVLPDDSWVWVQGLTVYVERAERDGVVVALADDAVPLEQMTELFKKARKT